MIMRQINPLAGKTTSYSVTKAAIPGQRYTGAIQ
jgi:hypothetical protein